MKPSFLTHPNKDLINKRGPTPQPVKEGSSHYKARLEEFRLGRLVWARRLSAITGLNIVGSNDGHFVRLINKDQVDRLIKQLNLVADQISLLVDGHEPTGLSPEYIRTIGRAIATEFEAEYRRKLDSLNHGIARWLRSLPPGTVPGNPNGGAVRLKAARELALFWPWVKSMTGRHHFPRRSWRDVGSGLRFKVKNLVTPEYVSDVLVLNDDELRKVPLEVTAALERVATYLKFLGQAEVSLEQAQQADKFFGLLGLEVLKESPRGPKLKPFTTSSMVSLILRGTLKKSWEKAASEELLFAPSSELTDSSAQLAAANRIFVKGVSRLLNAAGITSNLTILEESCGPVRSTGIVQRVANLAEHQLRLAAIKAAKLNVPDVDVPKLDNVLISRNTTTVYNAIQRRFMSPKEREFWEPTLYQALWSKKNRLHRYDGLNLTAEEIAALKPQSRSLVVNEKMEDVRLSSILNGAAAGWIRFYIQHHATEALRQILDGKTNETEQMPRFVWKEIRWLLCYAKVWAAKELFERGDKWLGISPSYRRRLRRSLLKLFAIDKKFLEDSDMDAREEYCRHMYSPKDPFFSKTTLLDIGGFALKPTVNFAGSEKYVSLVSTRMETPSQGGRNPALEAMVSDDRTLDRLVMQGRNMSRRLLLCALHMKANGSRLAGIFEPIVPLDGPDPLAYFESIEASNGVPLSFLFDLRLDKANRIDSGAIVKADGVEFSLDGFDHVLKFIESRVLVQGFRLQWQWASQYPWLVSFGCLTNFQEVTVLRLAWDLKFRTE